MIKEVLERLLPDVRHQPTINNEKFVNGFEAYFKRKIKSGEGGFSVNKDLLLFPMSFDVLMHPDDYNSLGKDAVRILLALVVSKFYAAIKSVKEDYRWYVPPATDWFFRFSQCKFKDENGQEKPIEKGCVSITSDLTHVNFMSTQKTEKNKIFSVDVKGSKIIETNINPNVLSGMEVLGDGIYCFPYDEDMKEDVSFIANPLKAKQACATLCWSEKANKQTFYMKDAYIDISGSSDTRKGRNICHINSDAVISQHVQIRYNQATESFQLAAYAWTLLNESEVPLSNANETPKWMDLPRYNSRLLLGERPKLGERPTEKTMKRTVSIDFNAN
jgi:hypothetical protein